MHPSASKWKTLTDGDACSKPAALRLMEKRLDHSPFGLGIQLVSMVKLVSDLEDVDECRCSTQFSISI